MVTKLIRPFSFLLAMGAMVLLAFAVPASSEGYGDPAITPADGTSTVTTVEPGQAFTVRFGSNVECAWSSSFNGQTGPRVTGFDYAATFEAPTDPGRYVGRVICRFSAAGPFRPAAYSPDADLAATRDQSTTQTFTVVVAGDGDDATDNASDSTGGGALADTGGDNWQLLALGAGLVVVGGGVAVAARRRTNS